MTGKHHLFSGCAIAAVVGYEMTAEYGIEAGVLSGISCIVGSLLPDIDTKASMLSCRFRVVSFFVRKLMRHRTYTHTIWHALLWWGIAWLIWKENTGVIPYLAVLGLTIGILDHLFMDSLTKGGIKPFYPFAKSLKISFTPFKTGARQEPCTLFIGTVIFGIGCFFFLQSVDPVNIWMHTIS